MRLVHGGDVTGFEDEYGYEPLDFSANISPLGLPEAVRDAIIASLDDVDAYPDPLCRRLVEAIGVHEGLDPSLVICGNGSADVIYRLSWAIHPKRALLCAPTFSEYGEALSTVGCAIDHHLLDRASGFRVGRDILDDIGEGTDIVFLCQPNNPTGMSVARELTVEVLERCERVGARLIVDECFTELIDDPASVTVTDLLEDHPALFVLKAFTKLYGMPGVRLGYGLSGDQALIEGMHGVAQPWAVSTMAQAAGIAALHCDEYVEQVRELIALERAFIISALRDLGIAAQGEANFLFFGLGDGGRLVAAMRSQGVLIRDCSNYVGLESGWYRIAVRSHDENVRMLDALRLALAEKPTGEAPAVCRSTGQAKAGDGMRTTTEGGAR